MKVTAETVPMIDSMFEMLVMSGECYNEEAKRLLGQQEFNSNAEVKTRLVNTSMLMASMARVQLAIAANLFKSIKDFIDESSCHKQPS